MRANFFIIQFTFSQSGYFDISTLCKHKSSIFCNSGISLQISYKNGTLFLIEISPISTYACNNKFKEELAYIQNKNSAPITHNTYISVLLFFFSCSKNNCCNSQLALADKIRHDSLSISLLLVSVCQLSPFCSIQDIKNTTQFCIFHQNNIVLMIFRISCIQIIFNLTL